MSMNNQKPDPKAVDQEDGDHTQPMNLVAQRAAVPITTFSGQSSQSAVTQPVTMRAHIDPTKSALMTLYFRTPTASRPPGPGQVIAPVMAASVASAQHFTTKPGFKGFKSLKVGYYQDKTTEKSGGESFNIKVIRMPANDTSQSQGISTTQTASGSPAPGMLPASISSSSTNRHIVPTAVHPVVPTGSSSCGPMASIIRSAHQVPQTAHVMHQPYSSHVPRGPAAVASISAAPKSAVATPILRPPHSSATVTLASASSMITSHPPTRSPTLVAGRTTTPPVPVASSPSVSQVIDLQKGSTGHSLPSSQVQIGLTSRSVEGTGAAIRTGIPHASSITISKPINISQPIVQHLQQVNEKGFLKTVSSVVTSVSTVPSNSSPHQSTSATPGMQIGSDAQALGVISNITRTAVPTISVTAAAVAPSVAYSSSALPLSTAASVAQHSVSSLRPPLVHPPSVHSLATTTNITTAGPVTPHQTFTVISAKTLPQSNQSVTLAAPPARASTPGPSIVATSGTAIVTCASILSVSTSRPLNTANSLCQAAIPVAKVYPQPLPVPAQSNIELSNQENSRSGVFIAQSQQNTLTTTAAATTAVVTSSMTPVPQAVVLSESRSESSASVRFPPLPKTAVGSGTSYAVPPAAYYYETYPVPGTIAMHPYPVSSSNQGFTATIPSSPPLRPGIFPQHGSGTLSSPSHPATCAAASPVAPVRPLNSLMVTVDPSRHHVALHPTYNPVPSGGISSTEVVVSQTSCTTGNLYTVAKSGSTPVGLSSASLVSTSFNSAQSQGNISNHNTSPRPSILRKRTSDGVSAVAKKNLMANISSSDPTSPHPDTVPSINLAAAPSPKPFGDQLRENGSVGAIIDSEVNRLSLVASTVTIKKEPGIFEKGFSTNNSEANIKLSVPVETSPRKKPRKQLLAANELIETHSSDGEDEFEKDVKENIKEFCREDEETIKWVTFCKRPSMSLLNSYRHTWKSRHNHFVRYTDVKPKEEKKPTVNDLANQKGVLQKANGWKIYHLTAQMDEVIGLEDTVYSRLSQLLDFVEKDPPAWKTKPLNSDEDKILNKLTDLIKGNLQRSKIVQDQVIEAKQQVIKVLEHKPHIVDIVSKYISKRPVKKKEKN